MLRAKSSQVSFYGNHIYDRLISKDHFLKLLDKAVDFSFVNELCRDAYTPDFGRPAYGPEMMFKMIFLQFLVRCVRPPYRGRGQLQPGVKVVCGTCYR